MVAWQEVAVSAAVSVVVTLLLTWLAFRVEIERRLGRLETLNEAYPGKDLSERLHRLEFEVLRLKPAHALALERMVARAEDDPTEDA